MSSPARRLTPRGLGAAFAAMIAFVAVAPAAAAQDIVTVSTSDVKSAGDAVTGVLTLTSKAAIQVDAASLRATIDDEDRAISITQGAIRQRTSMLVIDTSGSMGPQGMATVRAATATYLKEVPSDVRVGVVSFANTAGVDLAPTTDRAPVQRVANGLTARGNTALYGGIQSAVKALGATGDRSIVLLSDGADTIATNQTSARNQAIAALKAAGIRVDVVRFRSNDPDAAPALQGFAAANGGTLVSADNTAGVVAAFRASAKALESQVPYSIKVPSTLRGPHKLTLRGKAGASEFLITRTIDFGTGIAPTVTPPAAAPTIVSPGGNPLQAATLPDLRWTSQSWFLWVAALLVGLALFLGLGAVLSPTLQTRREKRVADIENYVAGVRRSRSEGKAHATPITEQLIGIGERAMRDRKGTKSTMALIDRADLPLRAGEWFLIRGIAVVIGVALGLLFLGSQPLVGVAIGAAVGAVLPPAVLRFLARRRADKFERALPDVLMLVATSLSSGFGLTQALDAVARDAAEPAAKEFSRALAETRIGTDISDALEKMAVRMDSTSMRWAVMAIRIQREVGGNLADTLRTTANTLREREGLRRQVQTLSAEGRLSAVILIMLPIGIFLYMTQVNYAYISLLWTTTTGLFMSAFGIVMIIIGSIWMRNIVDIEV